MKSNSTDYILEIAVNDKQADFLEAVMYGMDIKDVKVAGMVGGIGSGKSVAMSDLIMAMKEELPRAKGQFACPAVTQAKRALTPGLKSNLRDRWNSTPFHEETGTGDYVMWKEPPKFFDRPYEEPDDWSNCICWPDGFTIELCGYKFDPDAHRGRNDDFVIIDEALRFKREWLKIAQGRIRANMGKFDSNLHWLFAFFSSPPYGSDGEWMWEYEELSRKNPKKYHFTQVRTKDNELFLPKGYAEGLKDSLTELEYKVEVLGERMSRLPKCYYPTLSWDLHCDIDDILNFYDPHDSLEISVDLNAHFTCCTTYQNIGRLCRGQKALFVREPIGNLTMAQSIAHKFNDAYPNHVKKRVYVTGDRNGQNQSAGSNQTMFEQLNAELVSLGWEVILSPLNFNPEGQEKYFLIHDIFSEANPKEFYLRCDPTGFKGAIVSMQYTPITPDYKKDKKSETRKGNQELATHFSDTVDYYMVWKKRGGAGYTPSGFDIDFY